MIENFNNFNNFNNLSDFNVTVSSSRVKFYKMKTGDHIIIPAGRMYLCATISGLFTIYVKEGKEIKECEITGIRNRLFFEKELEVVCCGENSKFMVAEFELSSNSAGWISPAAFNGIFTSKAYTKIDIFKVFFSIAEDLEDNSPILNCWLALLVVTMRNEYLRYCKSTLEKENGAIFYGNAPSGDKDLELLISDAFLVTTNNKTGERKSVKFHCDYRFIEGAEYVTCQTECYENYKDIKYAHLTVPAGRYFKLWLYPENQQKGEFSPFTHAMRFSFSIKTNMPIALNSGISNMGDFEQICQSVEIDGSESWNDFLITLFGTEMPEKVNRYVRIVIEYIDKNYKNKITVPRLAELIHLHPNYLSRVFKEYMGCSVSQYVNNKRIIEVKRMLTETGETIDSIAGATGFYDSHHLQKCFKESTGYTPAEYRRKAKSSS